MKKYIYLAAFLSVAMASAQERKVGINTAEPKTTLEVVAPAEATHPAGMQAPRLTRAELTALEGSYTAEQVGALVYITDVSGGNATGQRVLVTEVGYYYFDGTRWERAVSTAEYANIYIKNGTLTDNRTVTQNDKTLTFTKTTGLTVFENTTGTATSPKAPLQIKDGAQGEGQVLASDAVGNAFWDVAAVPRVEGTFSAAGGTTMTATGTYYNTGASITLPEGNWALSISGELSIGGTPPTSGPSGQWLTVWLGTNNVPGSTPVANRNQLGLVTGPGNSTFDAVLAGTDGRMNTNILAAGIIDAYASARNNIKGMAMIKVPAGGKTYYVYTYTLARGSVGGAIGTAANNYNIQNYFKADGQNTYFYALRLAD